VLARLLPDAGEMPATPADPEFAQSRLFEVLLSLFSRLGEQAPLVLVIEDMHWADRSTRDFLRFLVRATRPSGSCWSRPTAPTSCTAATRCARS
jgi:predicted ATPase